MGPGGVNLAEPNPPGVNAMGIPSAPMPSGAKLPPVTDDPSVAGAQPKPAGLSSYLGMPALPTAPDTSNNPVNSAYRMYQDTLEKRMALQPPAPANYKPSLWDRVKGGAVGALVGGLSENADKGAAAGSRFTYSKYNHAAGDYGRQSQTLDKQLEEQKGGAGLAEAAGKIPETDFENRLHLATEGRERYTAITNADNKEAIAQIREEAVQGNIEKAQNIIDQKQKELEEKKIHDAEWFQMKHALLDLQQQIADQKGKDAGKGKPGQFKAANDRKNAGLVKAKAIYDKETADAGTDPVALKKADDNFKEAEQEYQDAFEQDNASLGGEPEHQNVESWRGQGAQPAAAAPVAPAAAATPAAKPAATENAVPSTMGPKGETPTKTASDGKTKIGFYKSTGQWMLVPTSGGK